MGGEGESSHIGEGCMGGRKQSHKRGLYGHNKKKSISHSN